MPRHVTEVEILKKYILGVMERAEHHAQNVDEICLAVAGAVIWRADRIEVYQRKGIMGNALWLYIGEDRYVLSFNHKTGEIEVRSSSTQGSALFSVSNATSVAQVKQFFAGL